MGPRSLRTVSGGGSAPPKEVSKSFHPNQQRRLIQEQGGSPLETFRSALKTKKPWESIQDFAMHPSFCGQRLYPRQLTLLKLIYLETENMTPYDLDVIEEWREGFKKKKDVFGVQPDIWERVKYLKAHGYTHFPHVQAVLGRRAGKGYIGGILGAERIAYFHSMDSWQKYFGIKQGTEGWLQVYATSQQQAQRTVFADIRYLVESCKYLQPWISTSKEGYFAVRTPSDLRRIAELESKKVRVEREIASLKAIALSSNSATGRGLTTYCIAFDEMAHLVFGSGSTKSGEEIYECLHPDTEVRMADGSLKRVAEVVVGDRVLSPGDDDNMSADPIAVEVVDKWSTEKPERYEIELEDGTTVQCSGNHGWFTQRGWVRSCDLTEEDEILELGEIA